MPRRARLRLRRQSLNRSPFSAVLRSHRAYGIPRENCDSHNLGNARPFAACSFKAAVLRTVRLDCDSHNCENVRAPLVATLFSLAHRARLGTPRRTRASFSLHACVPSCLRLRSYWVATRKRSLHPPLGPPRRTREPSEVQGTPDRQDPTLAFRPVTPDRPRMRASQPQPTEGPSSQL